jgi:hypothetical protein
MVTHADHDDGSDSPYYPRIILCIPGPWEVRELLERRLLERGFALEEKRLRVGDTNETFEAEFRGPDPRMKAAFQASACRLRPSLTPADFHLIEAHRSVLYVLSDSFGRTTAAAAAARMLEVGRVLLDAGGIAVKCESSGISHSADRWRRPDLPLFEAFVRLPITDEDDLYSVGMHLLGLPDAIVAVKDCDNDIRVGARVIEEFLRSLRSGESVGQATFKAEGREERYLAMPEPCTGYEPDDFFWNRWGRLRLRPG